MAEPFFYEDARENVEELKKYQIINTYALFCAITKHSDKISSLKDFHDLYSDIENEYDNLKKFKEI